MADIQAPELSLELAKRFNIMGGATVRTLEESIFPVFVVGSVETTRGKAYEIVAGVRVAGVVGQLTYANVNVIPTARGIFTIDRFTFNPGASDDIDIRESTAESALSQFFRKDARGRVAEVTIGGTNRVAPAVGLLIGALRAESNPAASDYGVLRGYQMRPGDSLSFVPASANTPLAITVSGTWEPRP